MQRIVLPCVASTLLSFSAFASPLELIPDPAPPPAGVISSIFGAAPQPAPAPARVAQGPTMGGGFLEMLFRPPGGQSAPPTGHYQSTPQVAPELMPGPRYHRPRPQAEDGPEALQSPRASLQPDRPAPNPRFDRQEVSYDGKEKPGTVIINTKERLLYLVKDNGKALRYGIGVGRPGFTWAGAHSVTQKREWPDWRPPPEMIKRQPTLPRYMPGGPDNPLGARAMYLGSTLYRIHGSNEPWTIGQAVSSGCIRMRNEDVIHLYEQVKVGTRVVVI